MNAIVPRKLSHREMQALDSSIREQIGKQIVRLSGRIEALVLWQLHFQKGWGVKRLEEFLNDFRPALQELIDFYGLEDTDDVEYACVQKLKSIGFDTDKLGKAFPVEWTINGRK